MNRLVAMTAGLCVCGALVAACSGGSVQVAPIVGSATPAASMSASPTVPASGTPVATATASPTAPASGTPLATPTATPTTVPTTLPTTVPTGTPTTVPTGTPTTVPSGTPTTPPTITPTLTPTTTPTTTPTMVPTPVPTTAGKLFVSPSSVTLGGTGSANAQSVTVSEAGYSGTYAESDTCAGIATVTQSSGNTAIARRAAAVHIDASAPSGNATYTVTGLASGKCTATFTDSTGQTAPLSVTVTTNGFTISSRPRAARTR